MQTAQTNTQYDYKSRVITETEISEINDEEDESNVESLPNLAIELRQVKAAFNKYLYLEDDNVIDVVLATVIGNRREIDPIWLFLVDPPSSGKTEILRTLTGAMGIHTLSTLSPKSLISGAVNKSTYKTRNDPSLFAHINNKCLIVKDFTAVLSMHRDAQNEIFGLLRDAYDGYCEKKLGREAQTFSYNTKFGFLSGVTLQIDNAYLINSYLGERFIKYRLRTNRDKAQLKAEDNRSKIKGIRTELNEVVRGFLSQNFREELPTWENDINQKLRVLGDIITRLRTPVIRNFRDYDIVEVMPEPEMPMRFDTTLRNLGDSLAIIRGKSAVGEDELRVLIKIAKDCLQDKVLRIFRALLNVTDPITAREIGEATDINSRTITRTCDDLNLLRVIEIDKAKSNGYLFKLRDDIRAKVEQIKKYI